MTIEEIQKEIVEEFSFFEDWEQRYEYLIELGKDLKEMPEDEKTDDKLIKGCQSSVWLDAQFDGEKINFNKQIGSFYTNGSWSDNIPIGSTLMFELVSPRNKIVCKYLETKLYLHGYRDPDLIEHNPREINFKANFEFPEILNASNIDDLKK